MQILVDVAGDIDHRQASSLFLPALPRIAKRLSAEEFYRWRYNRGFGNKTKQVALHAGNEIIGQAIVFSQIMVFGHRILRVAQLGDLIVKNEYRSPAAVYAIYNGIKQELHSGEYDLAFTLPNERSVVFNQRFLGLQPSKPLPSRMSLGVPCRSGTVGFCKLFSSNDDFWNGAGRELISPITEVVPVFRTAQRLF